MTRQRQIDEESTVIHDFREKYPAFPKGKLIKNESPDFILKVSGKYQIGIELCEWVKAEEQIAILLLQKLLKVKSEKLHAYKSKWLNEYWLLIYTENDLKCMNHKTLEGQPQSFDRIFLFDLYSSAIMDW